MPRRRRTSKLRTDPTEIAEMFLCGDGVHAMLDLEPTYENRLLAAVAWEAFRLKTWTIREEYSHPWIPTAAEVYDGITQNAITLHAHELRGVDLARAAAVDLKNIAAFRRSKPSQAAEIAEFLDSYEATVATAHALGKQSGRRFVHRGAFERLRTPGKGAAHVEDDGPGDDEDE